VRDAEEIDCALRNLSTKELSEFRACFRGFDAELWDQQFTEDVPAGHLDELVEEALAEHRTAAPAHSEAPNHSEVLESVRCTSRRSAATRRENL
jgi:hypothetical protein